MAILISFYQINRPIAMKKDGIQTRKRKPKTPAKDGKPKPLSSSYSYLKDQQWKQPPHSQGDLYQLGKN